MKGMLTSIGYEETAGRDEADLILFNTCSIRENADNRFISHLGEAKRLKTENPDRIVGVGGCWAQSVKDEVFRRFPFVDVAFGPGQIHRLAEFLNSDSLTAQGYFEFEEFPATFLRTAPASSRAGSDLAGQLRLLVLASCHRPGPRREPQPGRAGGRVGEAGRRRRVEVTLLGQNVNSYGRDLPPRGSHPLLRPAPGWSPPSTAREGPLHQPTPRTCAKT
jgi:tRNA-2-methylthio-N6-dimethylallyladenosine synthase